MKTNKKVLLAAAVLAVLGAGLFVMQQSEGAPERAVQTAALKNTISGLPEGAKVQANLKTAAQPLQELEVFARSGGEFELGVDALPDAYRLSYSLRDAKTGIHDIVIDVNQNIQKARVKLSGFEPALPLSLTYAGATLENAVPADWAGRLEFDLEPQTENAALLCLNWLFDEREASLCHVIGRKGAA